MGGSGASLHWEGEWNRGLELSSKAATVLVETNTGFSGSRANSSRCGVSYSNIRCGRGA